MTNKFPLIVLSPKVQIHDSLVFFTDLDIYLYRLLLVLFTGNTDNSMAWALGKPKV